MDVIKEKIKAIQYIIDNGLIAEDMMEDALMDIRGLENQLNNKEDVIEPSHYKMPIEALKDIAKNEDSYKGFLHLNAVKYLHRLYIKHETPEDDINKAIWYLNKLLEEENA